jgi:hypothetical protein
MNERKEVISKNIENVICTMGTQSKKPNSVVMAISDDIIMDALSLYRDKKKSVERTEGLLRYELVAVYAEEDKVIKQSIPFSKNPVVQDFLDSVSEAGIDDSSDKVESMIDDLNEVVDG